MTYHPPEEFDAWQKERRLAMNDEEKACRTKKTYRGRQEAKKAKKNAPKKFKIYKCPYCQGFHLATKKAPAPKNEGL